MHSSDSLKGITFTLSKDEALVLFEMLQRFTQDDEQKLLPLMHSSAEFAVLCRMNSHLEKILAEPFLEDYEAIVRRARDRIRKESGAYVGIEEK